MVRRGYVAAFVVPAAGGAGEGLVIVAERAAGTSRSDPQPALDAIREAVLHRHGLAVSDVRVRAGRRHSTDHQRQAGPLGVPEAVSERRTARPLAAYVAANLWNTIFKLLMLTRHTLYPHD